jgi:hypothetical protein
MHHARLALIRTGTLEHICKTALELVGLGGPETLPQIRLAEGICGGMREKFHMVFTVTRFITAENFSVGLVCSMLFYQNNALLSMKNFSTSLLNSTVYGVTLRN